MGPMVFPPGASSHFKSLIERHGKRMDGWVSGWIDGTPSTTRCLGETREEKGLNNENIKKIQSGIILPCPCKFIGSFLFCS